MDTHDLIHSRSLRKFNFAACHCCQCRQVDQILIFLDEARLTGILEELTARLDPLPLTRIVPALEAKCIDWNTLVDLADWVKSFGAKAQWSLIRTTITNDRPSKKAIYLALLLLCCHFRDRQLQANQRILNEGENRDDEVDMDEGDNQDDVQHWLHDYSNEVRLLFFLSSDRTLAKRAGPMLVWLDEQGQYKILLVREEAGADRALLKNAIVNIFSRLEDWEVGGHKF